MAVTSYACTTVACTSALQAQTIIRSYTHLFSFTAIIQERKRFIHVHVACNYVYIKTNIVVCTLYNVCTYIHCAFQKTLKKSSKPKYITLKPGSHRIRPPSVKWIHRHQMVKWSKPKQMVKFPDSHLIRPKIIRFCPSDGDGSVKLFCLTDGRFGVNQAL